ADAERRRIITADSGRMAYSAGGRDLYLTLQDGDIEEVSRADPTQFNRTFFSTNRMRVAGVANTFQPTTTDTYKSDREMSTCEMQEAVESARRDVESATGDARLVVDNDLRRLAGLAPLPPRALAAAGGDLKLPSPYCRALRRLAAWLLPAEAGAQTPRPAQRPTPPHPGPRPLAPSTGRAAPFTPPYVAAGLITPGAGTGEEQRLRAARERAAAYEVEIQKKYAIALACLVFALVGAPIALRFQRGGVGLVLGVSVAVFTVYYIGLIGGEELGDRLILSPFFAMWTDKLSTYLGRGIPKARLAYSYVFFLPETISLVLPVAVLFAVVFTVGTLGRHSELVAAKASGISFHRVVRPLLAASLAAVVLDLGLTELAPVTSARRAELLGEKAVRQVASRFNPFVYRADSGWV